MRDRTPLESDNQVRALRAATAASKAWAILDEVAQLATADGEGTEDGQVPEFIKRLCEPRHG